jgi:hypothetical protein
MNRQHAVGQGSRRTGFQPVCEYKPGAGFARQSKKGTSFVFRHDLVFCRGSFPDTSLARALPVNPK